MTKHWRNADGKHLRDAGLVVMLRCPDCPCDVIVPEYECCENPAFYALAPAQLLLETAGWSLTAGFNNSCRTGANGSFVLTKQPQGVLPRAVTYKSVRFCVGDWANHGYDWQVTFCPDPLRGNQNWIQFKMLSYHNYSNPNQEPQFGSLEVLYEHFWSSGQSGQCFPLEEHIRRVEQTPWFPSPGFWQGGTALLRSL